MNTWRIIILVALAAVLSTGCSHITGLPGSVSQPVDGTDYACATKAVFCRAWIPPEGVQNPEATAKAIVTIARNGKVVSAKLVEPSGVPDVDASVRRILKRVKFVAPFPVGSEDEKRTFTIRFNLKAKRQLG